MAATPSSQHRLTRSQTRLRSNNAPVSSKPPANAESTSKTKAGRRVLADIASNDSPIIGLVPAGTPCSNLKSAINCRSRTPFPIDDVSPGSTPIGENLLRSQVQLLLQKVEKDIHRAPTLRTLCHINGFLDSPTRLAAPTPVNTPAAMDSSAVAHHAPPVANPEELGTHPEESGVKLFVDLGVSSPPVLPQVEIPPASSNISDVKIHTARTTGQVIVLDSVTSGRDSQALHTTPSVSQIGDVETPDLFLGKQITRTLLFDSPDKSAATEISVTLFDASTSSGTSPNRSVRELEDDETSEWSVLVNVSSPAGKQDETFQVGHDAGETANTPCAKACSVHEHVQKARQASNKLDLLWSERSRRGTPYRHRKLEDEEEEDDEMFEEEDYYTDEGEEEDNEEEDVGETAECEDLCNSFVEMKVMEEEGGRKGLPHGEGKHIRFVYDSDEEEIKEQNLVRSPASSSNAIYLRGLPAPMGKHLRFCEAADCESISPAS